MSKATDPTGAKPANIVSPIAKRKHEDDTVEACKEKRHCVTQDSNQVSKGVQSISIAADVVAFAKGKANFNQRFSTDNVSIAPMKSMAQRLTEISRVTTDIDLKLKVVVLMDIKEFGEEIIKLTFSIQMIILFYILKFFFSNVNNIICHV